MRHTALIYIRKSVVRSAADEVSPERQRAACLAEAQRRGWACNEATDVYVDAEGHQSGRDPNRPAWQGLQRRLAADPHVAAVVVESLSRASRSLVDFFTFARDLADRGVALISIKENFDTGGAMGRAAVYLIAVFNNLYAEIASEDMARNIDYKRRHRGRHWGIAPFGSQREGSDKTLVPTPAGIWITTDGRIVTEPQDEAIFRGYHDALRRCYELYAGGAGGSAYVADVLNAEGYRFRNRQGRPRIFTDDDVRRLLSMHELYAGSVTIGSRKNGTLRDVVEGAHAPILPTDLCEAVATTLGQRHVLSARFGERRDQRIYVLGNILLCDECGQRMSGQFDHGSQVYRHKRLNGCPTTRGRFPCQVLDRQVLNALAGLQLNAAARDELRAVLSALDDTGQARQWETLQALHRRRLENLKAMRVEGELSREEYYSRKAEIERELATLGPAPAGHLDLGDVFARFDTIGELAWGSPPEWQRDAVQGLLAEVRQRRGEVISVRLQEWAYPFF